MNDRENQYADPNAPEVEALDEEEVVE